MEIFKLIPKKGFAVAMKINRSEVIWQKLFRTFMEKDAFAPLMVMTGYLDIVMDESFPAIVAPYAQRYAWIGELMADAEHEEIEDAAKATGLYSQGLNDFVVMAISNIDRKAEYTPILEGILSLPHVRAELLPKVLQLCESDIETAC